MLQINPPRYLGRGWKGGMGSGVKTGLQ